MSNPKKKGNQKVGRKTKATPTVSRSSSRRTSSAVVPKEMIFDKENYKWMAIGFGIILLGMLLMIGGAQPSPDVWDADSIYSFRRTVLAPFIIIVGLVVEIYAIFKK